MIPNWLLGKSKSKLQEILGGGGGGGTTYTAGEGIDITNHEISVDPLLMVDIEQTALAIPTKAPKTAISNPNILINPWFTVNQRGFTTAYSPSVTYVADRWKVLSASGITITNSDGGITIDNTNGADYVTMETILAPNISKSLLGRKVTMSLAKVIGETDVWKTVTMPNSLPQSSTIIDTASTEEYTLRIVITGNGNVKVDVQIKKGENVTIRAIKLEIGDISTLARDPRPDMATELAKCQRYFQRISNTTSASVNIAMGGVTASTATRVALSVPSQMRADPTISITGLAVQASGGSELTGTYTETKLLGNILSILISTPNSSLTIGHSIKCVLKAGGYIDLSAEL